MGYRHEDGMVRRQKKNPDSELEIMNRELSPALDAGVISLTKNLIIWLIRLVYVGGKIIFRKFGIFLVKWNAAGKRLGSQKSLKEAAENNRIGLMGTLHICWIFILVNLE